MPSLPQPPLQCWPPGSLPLLALNCLSSQKSGHKAWAHRGSRVPWVELKPALPWGLVSTSYGYRWLTWGPGPHLNLLCPHSSPALSTWAAFTCLKDFNPEKGTCWQEAREAWRMPGWAEQGTAAVEGWAASLPIPGRQARAGPGALMGKEGALACVLWAALTAPLLCECP